MTDETGAATAPDRNVSPALREVLDCPVDHGELREVERTLVCVACGRTFPVRDGVPDMTVAPVD